MFTLTSDKRPGLFSTRIRLIFLKTRLGTWAQHVGNHARPSSTRAPRPIGPRAPVLARGLRAPLSASAPSRLQRLREAGSRGHSCSAEEERPHPSFLPGPQAHPRSRDITPPPRAGACGGVHLKCRWSRGRGESTLVPGGPGPSTHTALAGLATRPGVGSGGAQRREPEGSVK